MLNEKELINSINNTNNNSNPFTPAILQDFLNNLSWETEHFTYDREQLIQDIEQLYLSYFHEPTEAVKKRSKIIFPLANNSAFLNIEYKTISTALEVIRVTDLYID